ncbi:MAG: radical SAM protein [Nitrospinae bacterium]|nr:radical SAM protein [Nitrospinota bacterium]
MIRADFITGRGNLQQIRALYGLMGKCRLCPRRCLVRRLEGRRGVCRSGVVPVVASATLHRGEEPPISGKNGSGTVFFSGCNMGCVYCQNYPISQLGVGKKTTVAELAEKMLGLQRAGAENVNFVTPTHFAAQTAHAVLLARRGGLSVPVVWNSSGYESVETIRLLDGFVDVYLCDYRYATPELAKRYSGAEDYPLVVEEAIEEMLRQCRVIIRHLCLPGQLAETEKVLGRINARFGNRVEISFMSQYFPAHRADEYPEINRRLGAWEKREARRVLDSSGLENGWLQE